MGDPPLCLQRGREAAQAGDSERALDLLQQACAGDVAEACFLAGESLWAGQWVERDAAGAYALLSKACELGDPNGCNNAALLVFQGVPEAGDDLEAALGRLEVACEAEIIHACRVAGMVLARGEKVEADGDRAATVLQRGCNLDDVVACVELGVLLYRGEAGGDDRQDRAANLFAQACNRNNGIACRNLAVMHHKGHGVAKDERMAARMMEKGCQLQDEKACSGWASMLEEGVGVDEDREAAARVRKASCGRGYQPACAKGE